MFNRNSVIDEVNSYILQDEKQKIKSYPKFFTEIYFEKFRSINNLRVCFETPITVITGNNRCGKTTLLLTIAASHFNFQRRDFISGELTRNTWKNCIKFTKNDIQTSNWTYYVKFREGDKNEEKRGQRRFKTNKWNGVAKRESQIGTPKSPDGKGGREVRYIDLDRVIPEREKSNAYFQKRKNDNTIPVNSIIKEYVSYVMEGNYKIYTSELNKNTFYYESNTENYSSFNSASGEDVLSRMISEISEAPKTSLILIEEIEVGLHPEYIRRLFDIIFYESKINSKQFIITTHSPIVMSLVQPQSRIFIENSNGDYRSISNISINETYSKMDSKSFPLYDLYVEDDVSKKIVKLALKELNAEVHGIQDLVQIVISGAASKTYTYFICRKEFFEMERNKVGFACILDGDMRKTYKDDSNLLFYHYSNFPPEKFLLISYLNKYPNDKLSYYLDNIDVHYLFQEMVNLNIAIDKDDAFQICWNVFIGTDDGKKYFNELKNFLLETYKFFSPHF